MRKFNRAKAAKKVITSKELREEAQDQFLNAVEDVFDKINAVKTTGDLGMLLEPVTILDKDGKEKGTTPPAIETLRDHIYDPDNDQVTLDTFKAQLDKERARIHKIFGVG